MLPTFPQHSFSPMPPFPTRIHVPHLNCDALVTESSNTVILTEPGSNNTGYLRLDGTFKQLMQCGKQQEQQHVDEHDNVQEKTLLTHSLPPTLDFLLDRVLLKSDENHQHHRTWRDLSTVVALISRRIVVTHNGDGGSTHTRILDNIIGVVLCLILVTYSNVILLYLTDTTKWILPNDLFINPSSSTSMKQRVEWVMAQHAPLGLKLNPQIDIVLGHAVIMFIDFWNSIWSHVLIVLPPVSVLLFVLSVIIVVFAIVLPRIGAVSLMVALCLDVLYASSIHIAVLHRFFSRILRLQLHLLGSLALLMRGRKRNVLRNRVDTIRPDGAQLVLGSMMFSILAFILQTTLAHHILILLAWVCVAGTAHALHLVLLAVDAFPQEIHVWQVWKLGGPCFIEMSSSSDSSSLRLKQNDAGGIHSVWGQEWMLAFRHRLTRVGGLSTVLNALWQSLIWGKELKLPCTVQL